MAIVTASTQPRHTGRSAVMARQGPREVQRPRRTRDGLGAFGTAQLVTAELAVVALGLAVISGSAIGMGAVGALAATVLLISWGRSGGRWYYEVIAARMALRRRVASATAAAQAGTSPTGLRVHDHADRGGHLGIGQDPNGWFAALAVGGDDDLISGDPQTIRFDRLTRLLDEGSARPSSIQVVTLRVCAPSPLLALNSPCLSSYAHLRQTLVGDDPALSAQLTWIAVRLDALDALDATAERGGGLEGVARALAAAVGRVGKLLASSGVTYRVLDGQGLLDALDVCCGFDPLTGAGPRAEQWRSWRTAELAQMSFEVVGWPAQTTSVSLAHLAQAPGARVVTSAALRRSADQPRIGVVVRTMAAPDQIRTATERIADHASGRGFRLRPLHGLQGPAIYASAPTGGQAL